MTRPGEPPPAFFQHLERRTREARASLRAKGYEPTGFECWPPDEWPRGWWDLRRVRVHGVNSRGEERGILIDVQSDLFKRPIRRVARQREVLIHVRRDLAIRKADLDDPLLEALRDAFTYDNPDHKKKVRLGLWAGGVSKKLKTYKEEEVWLHLPRGGTDKVRRILQEAGRWPPRIYDERLELDPVDFEILPGASAVELRPDQERLVSAALERENCLIRAAAGVGKTEVGLELVRRIRQPAIVIVWTSSLMKQWIERIRLRWGWPLGEIGVWGGGKKRLGRITVAMQQSLWGSVDEIKDRFGVVIADEVARFAARTFRDVISQFPARYRIGLSEDERRKDRLEVIVHDAFGQVAAEVTRKEAVAAGNLCEVEIVLVPSEFRFPMVENAPRQERGQIVGQLWGKILDAQALDEDRNELITQVAMKAVESGKSTLVFVERTESVPHARILAARIASRRGVPCGLMVGGQENRDAFDEAKRRLREGSLKCAVGSKAVYLGEDIPRLEVGVIATPTANNKQLFSQQVGRIRRMFHGKRRGIVYYIFDHHVFPSHLENLRRWYGRKLVRVLDE